MELDTMELFLGISGILLTALYGYLSINRWRHRMAPLVQIAETDRVSNTAVSPHVSIIVTARNEVGNIGRCLHSLLNQTYPSFEIIVVDDRSTDDTALIVADIARKDPRVTSVQGQPLPDGWLGKAYAAYQGYRQAKGSWFLFTDADTEHAPGTLYGAIQTLQHRNAGFATSVTRIANSGVGAYLVNLGVWTFLFMIWSFNRLANPRSPESLINGQFLLLTRETYEDIGTHAAIRKYSSTDVSLGYLAKLKGHIPLVFDGHRFVTAELSRSFSSLYAGWKRSMVNGGWTAYGKWRGTTIQLFRSMVFVLFAILPWVFLVTGILTNNGFLIAASIAQVSFLFSIQLMHYRSLLGAITGTLLLPVASIIMSVIVMHGMMRAWYFGGTVWKGRKVRPPQPLPPWSEPH